MPSACYCKVEAAPHASFSDHPASACNTGNFFPLSKCDVDPTPSTTGLFSGQLDNMRETGGSDFPSPKVDPTGQTFIRLAYGLSLSGFRTTSLAITAAAAVDAALASGGPSTGLFTDTSRLDEYGDWIWNPFIDQWVMGRTELDPVRTVACAGADTVRSEIIDTSDIALPSYAGIFEFGELFAGDAGTTGTPTVFTTISPSAITPQPSSNGADIPFINASGFGIGSFSNISRTSDLQSNFMSIVREPYYGLDGAGAHVYSPVADFNDPSLSITSNDLSSGGIAAFDGDASGRQFSINYSSQEHNGLRYLFGFPATYGIGASRYQDYINDILDLYGESNAVTKSVYAFTYNKKSTPALSRALFEAFPATATTQNINVDLIAESMITPDPSATLTLRDVLNSTLSKGRDPGDEVVTTAAAAGTTVGIGSKREDVWSEEQAALIRAGSYGTE
tara:strand:- start:593 stop:1939 length:1347 start_codon:yes stop_codon:yes gene_type:complete